MAIDNPLEFYEIGSKAIEEGVSPGELELDLKLDAHLDRALIDEVMPMLKVLHKEKRLSESNYADWLKAMMDDPMSAGIPGFIVIISAIVLCLFSSFQGAVLLGLEHSNPLIAVIIAVLCLPLLGLLGIPLFAAARRYWQWRAWRVKNLHGPSLSARSVRLGRHGLD